MASVELKVARIGNSRGVRLPAAALRRFGIGATVVMEERSDGILLRSPGPAVPKLSWEETARAMAAVAESWDDMADASADGLAEIPWQGIEAARKVRTARPRGAGPKARKRT